jgi:hypothetical protein
MGLAVVADTAPTSRRRCVDVLEVIDELRRLRPKAGEETLAVMLTERLGEDPRLLLAASRALIRQSLASAAVGKRLRKAAPTPKARAARKVVEERAVAEIVGKVREQVALDMTVMLLDGTRKALRFCLRRELSSLGAAYVRIAQRIGADVMVGEALTSAEAQELMRVAV